VHRVSWKLAEARQGADFNYLRRKGTILWCYPSPGSAVGWQGFSVEIWRVPVITRGLIDASWDEGEIIRCELVVACCDSPTLFDLLEEPLDQLRARCADPMAREI
jgi:hypothetical protein